MYFDLVHGFSHDPYCRSYALDVFGLNLREAQPSNIPLGMDWRPPLHRVAKALWKSFPERYRQVYYEKFPFAYESHAVNPANPACYYWGYWQNPTYVESVADVLRVKLRFTHEAPAFAQLRDEIDGRQSLAIHVRRYNDLDKSGRVIASARHNHGVCDSCYFQRALELVSARGRHYAYIFSDDPEWCKINLCFPLPYSYISDLGMFSAAEELMLMAECKNHIISNSSFSWWGAWLGKSSQKTVVAPMLWNKTILGDQSDACPSTWLRL